MAKTVKPDHITQGRDDDCNILRTYCCYFLEPSNLVVRDSFFFFSYIDRGFAGAAIANGGFGAVNSAIVLKTASFILLAPVIGMIMAFIMSLWFLSSFRKGWTSKIFSVAVIVFVVLFLYNNLELKPGYPGEETHYDSYITQVIFYSKNFKWILMSFILLVMAVFALYLSGLNAHKSHVWFKRFGLFLLRHSVSGMAVMMPKSNGDHHRSIDCRRTDQPV